MARRRSGGDEHVDEAAEDARMEEAARHASILMEAEDLVHPLEAKVFQLVQDLLGTELPDDDVITKLNMIAEILEEAETSFRKERTAPYRREGHLIGNLLRLLDESDEFYGLLEQKLGELTPDRVKAAVCRLLLATGPVNSRFIVRLLYDEEMLERVCEYSTESEPLLRCYATGLLSVGLRDRSIADIVVNNETPIKFLKRVRMYASKLEKERQLALTFIQDNARNASARQKRSNASNTNGNTTSTSQQPVVKAGTSTGSTPTRPNLKRKYSEVSVRSTGEDAQAIDASDDDATRVPADATEDDAMADPDDANSVVPDQELHEESLKRLVMLELLYTLDCIGSMGEYLELFAPALKEDIIATIITFLHSKNPTVLSHTMKLTSHFLAHKKFAFLLIDAGGIELILATSKFQQVAGLLDRSLSMCLHGFASSSGVMEKVLAVNSEGFLDVAFQLLSSPNDRARQNAVVFFGLTVSFKVVLEYFEKKEGLYMLLNIVRSGTNLKSAAQRQLSHDACLCLRQYLRVHMALVTHRLRRKLAQVNHPTNRASNAPVMAATGTLGLLPTRVSKLSPVKPVDVDDKTHEQNLMFYEKYRCSVTSATGSGNAWSAATVPGGGMWAPAAKLCHLRGIFVLLEVVGMMSTVVNGPDAEETPSAIRGWIVERAQFSLECLRVLTVVVPSLGNEICSTEVTLEESGLMKRTGMTILLEIAMSTNSRDSDIVRDVMRVFCNCVSPPHCEDCWQHPFKDIRQYTMTGRSMRNRPGGQQHSATRELSSTPTGSTSNDITESTLTCCTKAREDKPLRPVRKLAREKNAIKVCVQLLRYKRSVHNADAIRLLATRALLGLARDRHIAQILEKMQLGQVLSDLIRTEPVLEENADLHVRFREAALDLISQVTPRAPNTVINEATDPTIRKIEKASIVAQTQITYDEKELLKVIHDHLASKGLSKAAKALLEEAHMKDESTDAGASTGKSSPPARRNTRSRVYHESSSNGMPTRVASNGYNSGEDSRPSKAARLLGPFQSSCEDERCKSDSEVPAPSLFTMGIKQPKHGIAIKLTHGLRKQRIKRALSGSTCLDHLANPTTQPATAVASHDSTSTPMRSARSRALSVHQDSAQTSASSRLDEIITHYLREQHRQCANPVTTVPPFKLTGNDMVHRCPEVPSTSSKSLNVFNRVMNRFRTGFGRRALGNAYADAGITRYLFSRYRPYRIVGTHGPEHWGGISVARFYDPDQRRLLIGNHEGEVRLLDIDTDDVIEEWTCHPRSSVVADLETNAHTRMGRQNRLMLTGSMALTGFGANEIAIWDINSMSSERWRFPGVFFPRFNHYGDKVVALDAREAREEGLDVDVVGDIKGSVVLDIATGQVLCDLKDNTRSNDYGMETNCCFSPCDSTILTDGVLWDARIPTRALYKFDKLSNVGYGTFHPDGNELIVNSAVWDLRTYRLLRMVPALDKCTVKFNSTNDIIYAYYPYTGGDDLERRRSKLKSWYRVLDARDYKDITTVELERPIFDLSVDSKNCFISVIEGRYEDSSSYRDTICRLYEIGRKRPSEDDSDVEDGHDDSDTLDDDEYDDESNSRSEDEEDEDDMDDGDEYDSEDDYLDDDDEEYDDVHGDDDDEADGLDIGQDDEGTDGEAADEEAARRFLGRGLSNREIRFLFELPDGGGYYDMHDQYSSDEDEGGGEED